jgi:hypothetical protein
MWVVEIKDKVFFYQEIDVQVEGNLQGNNMHFTIGIQTQWQREMVLRCGHESVVSIDATFQTNDKKVCNHDRQLNVCHVCVHFVITTHLNNNTLVL